MIALDLPADVRDEIGVWGQKGLADPALRRIAPENLNITLLFLGHRPEGQVERIKAGIKTVFEGLGAPWLELRNPESRPTRGRPRLFALPALSPEAEVLQVGLRALLVQRALYRPEPDERAFWPHVIGAVYTRLGRVDLTPR